jgi:hypothetical protein
MLEKLKEGTAPSLIDKNIEYTLKIPSTLKQ